jgi:GntR family transcriptional regulator/MocR family aminotransferase
VAISRQVHCSPEQIIIVAGAQGAFNLAAQVLLDEGDSIWMEDPGYFGARGAFLGAGAKVIPVPVDKEGIDVEVGIARAPAARLAYVTPSHQFPLGVTMSLARRLALLDWAKRADAYILEDDYDSEYRFSGRPLAALQSIDNAERVIYIGSFSKVLFPSLRIGYLILPQPLIEPFLTARSFIDSHTPLLEQAVLTDFMVEGHFRRHVRRMRILYAERRAAFIEAASTLPLEIQSAETGIYCIGWLADGMDDLSLVRTALAHDLYLWPVSSLCIEPLQRRGLIFGYGAYNPQAIKAGIETLAAIMRSI